MLWLVRNSGDLVTSQDTNQRQARKDSPVERAATQDGTKLASREGGKGVARVSKIELHEGRK